MSQPSVNQKPFAVYVEFLTGLTSGLRVLAQLKLHASVEFSWDQTIGYNHHHSRDEEENKQQKHIPEKQPKKKEGKKKNDMQREVKKSPTNVYQSWPWSQTNILEPVASGGKTGWWTNILFLIHIWTTCQNSAGGPSPCQHLGLNLALHLLYHLWTAFIHRYDKFADAKLDFICKVYLFAVHKCSCSCCWSALPSYYAISACRL